MIPQGARERDTSLAPTHSSMDSDELSKTVDVLRYGDGEDASSKYVTVPSDMGIRVVAAHRDEASRGRLIRAVLVGIVAFVGAGIATFYADIAIGILVAIIVIVVGGAQEYLRGYGVPELVDTAIRRETAEEEYDIHTHVEEPFGGGAVEEKV